MQKYNYLKKNMKNVKQVSEKVLWNLAPTEKSFEKFHKKYKQKLHVCFIPLVEFWKTPCSDISLWYEL